MDRFTDLLLPYLPGCPTAIIKTEVLQSAIRFCEDTWIWQQDAEKTIAGGEDEISFTLPVGSKMIGVQILINGSIVNSYTKGESKVTLDDAVASSKTFQTTVYLAPTRAASDLPDLLYDTWFEAVAAGAKVPLMMMPGHPWHNQRGAMVEQTKYLHEMGRARQQARKTNDQTELSVLPRPFI